jgi:hypothetical protein
MSNQIETTITVQLDNRDRMSVLLRIFLVVPIAIFVSAFTAWSGSSEASAFLSGLLFLPVLLALVFRGIYPSYVLDFNRSLLALSTRVTAYIFLLNDKYPSIEESEAVMARLAPSSTKTEQSNAAELSDEEYNKMLGLED